MTRARPASEAQAIKSLRPDVPVVLVTGWGVELPAEQLRATGVDRVMTKPFRLEGRPGGRLQPAEHSVR